MARVYSPQEVKAKHVASYEHFDEAGKILNSELTFLCNRGVIQGARTVGSAAKKQAGMRSDWDLLVLLNRLGHPDAEASLGRLRAILRDSYYIKLNDIWVEQTYPSNISLLSYLLYQQTPSEGNTVGTDPLSRWVDDKEEPDVTIMKDAQRKRLFFEVDTTPLSVAGFEQLERALDLPRSMGTKIAAGVGKAHDLRLEALPGEAAFHSLFQCRPAIVSMYDSLTKLDTEYDDQLLLVLADNTPKSIEGYTKWLVKNHAVGLDLSKQLLRGVENSIGEIWDKECDRIRREGLLVPPSIHLEGENGLNGVNGTYRNGSERR